MKRHCGFHLAVLLCLSGAVDAQDCPCRAEARPGQAVIQVVEGLLADLPEGGDEMLEALSGRLGGRPVLELLDVELALLLVEVGDGYVSDGALQELASHPDVLFADRNQVYRGATDDPDWPLQWGLRNSVKQTFCGSADGRTDISVDRAWAIGGRGAGAVAAVIDSGVIAKDGRVGPDHPDLDGHSWLNVAEVNGFGGLDDDGNGLVDDLWGWDFVEDDSHPQDMTGHGTFVASILGAEADNGHAIAGVAPEASLMHLRFLDESNQGDLATAVKAIDYAARQGASVVNMSWTACQRDSALEQAIRKWPGVVFVAAAGNSKRSLRQCPEYPAALSLGGELPNLVSVMGVACNRQRPRSSNWDADLAAPGEMIYAFNQKGRRDRASGTSVAAPHVSGVAALLRSFRPQLTAAQVVARLKCSADSAVPPGLPVEHGIVDAEEALRSGC